jgi:hypothetical protein
VPVHAAVLGALLYSRLGAVNAELPSSATWAAPSLFAASFATLVALVVLVPVVSVSLRVLVPGHVRKVGLAFAAMNAALLLPVREPTLIGGLLVACSLVLLAIDRRFEAVHVLRTFEGRLCRLLCVVPLGIMAGRAALYYQPTTAFVAACCVVVGWLWFSLFDRAAATRDAAVAQRLAILPTGIAACLLAGSIASDAWGSVCFAMIFALLLAPMARRAIGGSAFYVAAAGYAGCAALLFDAAVTSTTVSALLALLGGSAVMVAAGLTQRLGLLIAASLTTLTALVIELWLVIDVGALKHWGSVALAGMVLILGAALLERHGKRFGQRLRAFRDELTIWAW